MKNKKDIRAIDLDQIKDFLTENGEKAFRAKQIFEWLWKKSAISFDEMTNLSLPVRELLKEYFTINAVIIDDQQISNDRTIKVAFKLYDNKMVEGVLIPSKTRMTACISSQVGCSLDCKFCATSRLKRERNLNPDEIYDQVVRIKNLAASHYKTPLTNIVYMGMGEPLLNYKNTIDSVKWITSEQGLGMSPKRITVSTAGIAKMIRKLGDDTVRFNLALSLHAANDEKRNQLMSINEQNNLEALSDALRYFYDKTENRITLEYIIFKNFNDEIEDAKELAEFAQKVPSKINIIEYNPIEAGEYQQADPKKVDAFVDYLEKQKLIVNVRRSRGKDIDAACGQLAGKRKE